MLLATVLLVLWGSTYHLAADGDDTRTPLQAQQVATPWRSLERLDSVILYPGDSLLVRRGDTLRGRLIPRQKANVDWTPGLIVGAYGVGALPVISGNAALPAFGAESLGVWRTQGPVGVQAAKFWAGRPVMAARIPAKGWLPIVAPVGDTGFEVPDLPTRDWTGAWVHFKSAAWNIDGRRIAWQRGARLGFSTRAFARLTAGWGYFVSGVRSALSGPGQWAQDSATGWVWWWPEVGQNPALGGELSVRSCGIDLRGGRHDITVQDLRFVGQMQAGVCGEGSSRITVKRVQVADADQAGIRLYGRDNAVLDCRVERTTTAGIAMLGAQARIERDTVDRIGDLDLFGPRGFGDECCGGRGIHVGGDSSIVRGNRVRWTGWTGIWFSGKQQDIVENVVDSAVQTSNDGGGLYTYSKNYADSAGMRSRVHRNIVHDTRGNIQGASHYRQGQGIYLDLALAGMSIRDNLVSGCANGILLHDNRGDTVVQNLFWRNEKAVQVYRDTTIPEAMRDNRVDSNLMVSLEGQKSFDLVFTSPNIPRALDTVGNTVCRDDMLGLDCWRDGVRLWGAPRPGLEAALVGPEKFAVAGYGVRGWQGWPSFVKLAALPGGTADSFGFSVSYRSDTSATGKGLVLHVLGSGVDSGSWSRLRFRAKGAVAGMRIEAVLLQAQAPYKVLSARKWVGLETDWKIFEIALQTQASEPSARIDLMLGKADSLVWLDAISWRQLDLTRLDSLPRSRLLEAAADATVYSLPEGNWRDPWGSIAPATGVIGAWSWRVVLRDSGVAALAPPVWSRSVFWRRRGSGWVVEIGAGQPGIVQVLARTLKGQVLWERSIQLGVVETSLPMDGFCGLGILEVRLPEGRRSSGVVWGF